MIKDSTQCHQSSNAAIGYTFLILRAESVQKFSSAIEGGNPGQGRLRKSHGKAASASALRLWVTLVLQPLAKLNPTLIVWMPWLAWQEHT